MDSHWILSAALVACLLTTCTSQDADVLIVGGGVAGVIAATTLQDQGIDNYLVLAEKDHLNGFLEPVEFGGITILPGGLFAHTINKFLFDELFDIPIANISRESYTVYNDYGEDVTEETQRRKIEFVDAYYNCTEDIGEYLDCCLRPTCCVQAICCKRPDLSKECCVAREGWFPTSAVDKLISWFKVDYSEGVEAREVSTAHVEVKADYLPDEYLIIGDASVILGADIAKIPEDKVVYNTIADRIIQTEDEVQVEANGTTYSAPYAIVTSTVGVVQKGRVTFDPPLPGWKAEEFCRFQMGIRDIILLKFDEKFWDDTHFILHASDRRGYYPAFINMEAEGFHPEGTNILMGFLTGDEAYRAEYLSDEEVQDEVMAVLRNMYGDSIPDPTEFYFHRFATDETLYGPFANRPLGVHPQDAQRRLSAPYGRLYFAPEDAASESSITIPFGAILDGVDAANELAACIQDGVCEEYEAVDDPCTEGKKGRKNKP